MFSRMPVMPNGRERRHSKDKQAKHWHLFKSQGDKDTGYKRTSQPSRNNSYWIILLLEASWLILLDAYEIILNRSINLTRSTKGINSAPALTKAFLAAKCSAICARQSVDMEMAYIVVEIETKVIFLVPPYHTNLTLFQVIVLKIETIGPAVLILIHEPCLLPRKERHIIISCYHVPLHPLWSAHGRISRQRVMHNSLDNVFEGVQ